MSSTAVSAAVTGRTGIAPGGDGRGPLTEPERRTAQAIAADLGMTPAQAIGVMTMTELAAQD